jgi:hypothetical protein
MATLDQLSKALVNADAAGDVDAARALASEIKRMRAVPTPEPETVDSEGLLSELSGMSNKLGDATKPENKGVLRTMDDAVRGAADMLSFGLADEFAAKMGDLTGVGGEAGDYEQNLAAQRQRDSEGGGARLVGQLAGAFAMPGGAAKSVGGAALQGAALGAGYGFGSGEGGFESRLGSAAQGAALGGAAGGAVRAGANALERKLASNVIPSNETLSKAAQAAYKAADDAGVIIRPESTQRLTASIKQQLAEDGFDTALHPGVSAVLNRLDELQDQNVTLKGMDIVRRVAGNAAGDVMRPDQQRLVSKMINQIDDFVSDLKPADVLAGNSKEAANQMLKARTLWTRLKKAEKVDTAILKAERRAASTGSGGNADNAVRQNVRALLDNAKTARGMSAAEKKAAERVVRGTPTQNALRLAGKLAPTGVVSGTLSGAAGYGLAGPIGLGLPALGAGAKALADRMTLRNVDKLSQLIRSGGLTVDQVSDFIRQGVIPAPVGFEAIESAAKTLQTPTSRIASTAAERRPLEITVTPKAAY